IQRAAKAYLLTAGLEQWWKPERASAIVEWIRVDAPTLWERPPQGTVNLQNGLLDVATRTLRPHTPDWLSSVQFPAADDPAAPGPGWDALVPQPFPEDAHDLAWAIAAFVLAPDPSMQRGVLLTGEGSNGKSTFLAGIVAFLGKQNTAALSLHKL